MRPDASEFFRLAPSKKKTVWLLSHLIPYVSLLLCGTNGSSRMVIRMQESPYHVQEIS